MPRVSILNNVFANFIYICIENTIGSGLKLTAAYRIAERRDEIGIFFIIFSAFSTFAYVLLEQASEKFHRFVN